MSTIKVSNVQHGSAAAAAITLDANGQATLNGLAYPTSGSLSGRNRIINGDMRIDQRNAGASMTATTAAEYSLDRWRTISSASSKFSVQRNAGSVTPPAGFTNYLGVTSLAATTVASGDYYFLDHRIEGFNVADLAFGTANAATVTLSFWVRSSLTGTFGGALTNNGARSYPFTYSISAANTWERKTITIAGDTAGTWATDNTAGMTTTFALGVGSTYKGTAGAWAGATYWSASGAVDLVSTNGATFYLTGVQLEAGSVATPFERRSYGQELALCQRYYYRVKHDGITNNRLTTAGLAYSSTGIIPITPFLVEMRTAPTSVEQSGTAGHYAVFNASGSQITCSAVPAFNVAGKWYAETAFTVSSGLIAGNVTYGYALNSAAYLGWSAEL
jgi:hypothetical protein